MTAPPILPAAVAPSRAVRALPRTALGLAACLLLSGCGSAAPRLPGAAAGSVRAAAGSYRGVSLRDPMASLAGRLGPPLDTNDTPFLTPAVQPAFLPADNPYDIVYPDVRFTSVGGRVASISVYGRGARSDTGVRIGEALARVRSLPGARCVAARTGLDPRAPGCQVTPARGVYEYFSGDPVTVIALSGQSILP